MTEIEKTPDLISGDDIGSNILDHTIVADSFINVSASDPTAANDTGQGYVVGSLWVNSTSGDVFQAIGVDAENASWANQEGDDVNIFKIQGSNYGWVIGGNTQGPSPGYPASPNGHTDDIQKWAFSSPSNSSDVAEIAGGGYYGMNQGSIRDDSYCYLVGRENPVSDTIDRFPFSAPHPVGDVGELVTLNPPNTTASKVMGATDGTYGFAMGGSYGSPSVRQDDVTKITFASPAPAADSGAELTSARHQGFGNSDTTNSYMYVHGGAPGSPTTHGNIIERGAFSISTGTFTDHGDLTDGGHYVGAGSSSTTYGYRHGGATHPPFTYKNVIDKWPYASAGNASDVGDLVQGASACVGATSTSDGWSTGGDVDGSNQENEVTKYSHTSDANASDEGELAVGTESGTGCEN
jgi:hypothetical protein